MVPRRKAYGPRFRLPTTASRNSNRLFQRRARIDALRTIAFPRQSARDVVGMRGVARLDRNIEFGALGRHVEEQPAVIDLQDIGTELTQPRCDDAEDARPVRNGEAERDDLI